MFDRIRALWLKIRSLFVKEAGAASPLPFSPYKEETNNLEYNKLFCDNPALFRPSGKLEGNWKKLYSRNPFVEDLKLIAEDTHTETRIRILAFNELRRRNVVTPREILGVIIEVGAEDGLEAIALYKDHDATYVNAKGKVFTSKNAADVNEKIQDIMVFSQKIIEKAELNTESRQAPPAADEFRITFLATDGCYAGQGNLADIEKDPVAKALVYAAGDIMIALAKGPGSPKVEVPEKAPEKVVDNVPAGK